MTTSLATAFHEREGVDDRRLVGEGPAVAGRAVRPRPAERSATRGRAC